MRERAETERMTGVVVMEGRTGTRPNLLILSLSKDEPVEG